MINRETIASIGRNYSHYSFYALLVALLFLTACSVDEEPAGLAGQQGVPIGFDSYTAQTVTRAQEVERAIPNGGSIGVYAYYHDGVDTDGQWTDGSSPNFMFNQPVTFMSESDAFVYAPLKYWPNEVHDKVSFIAYYPYTEYPVDAPYSDADPATPTGVKPQLSNGDTGLPSFLFNINDDPDKQMDFLVSDLCPNLPNGTKDISPSGASDRNELTVTDRVHFYFRHALAKISFRIVVHPDIRPHFSSLKLNSLSITNIKDKGKLTLSYDPSTGTAFNWVEQATSTTDPDAHTFNIKVKDSYLMVPQKLVNDAMLNLDYELTLKGYNSVYTYVDDGHGNPVLQLQDVYTYKNPNASVQLNKMKISGTNINLDEWKCNVHYIYTIRLNADRIEYTGQVVDWGAEQVIDGIDIKEPES